MKLTFESNLAYQQEAMQVVVNLLRGRRWKEHKPSDCSCQRIL